MKSAFLKFFTGSDAVLERPKATFAEGNHATGYGDLLQRFTREVWSQLAVEGRRRLEDFKDRHTSIVP